MHIFPPWFRTVHLLWSSVIRNPWDQLWSFCLSFVQVIVSWLYLIHKSLHISFSLLTQRYSTPSDISYSVSVLVFICHPIYIWSALIYCYLLSTPLHILACLLYHIRTIFVSFISIVYSFNSDTSYPFSPFPYLFYSDSILHFMLLLNILHIVYFLLFHFLFLFLRFVSLFIL